MKKLSLLIALTLLSAGIALSPSTVKAQDDKQAEFERVWYDTCYTKKDGERCYQLSKELKEKYPDSTYIKNAVGKVTAYDQNKAWEKFQAALKAYYTPPQDTPKLENLFSAGEEYLKFDPNQQYVIGRMALAATYGAQGETYKDLDKVKSHAEKGLKAFESAAPPEGWKPEEWEPLREAVLAHMNQFLGWRLIQTQGDQEQAINYLTKATQVKGKDGTGWKDPVNYWLRSTIYSGQYTELRKQYDAMPDDQKTGDAGKDILKKVNDLVDTKVIPEYARVLATSTKPEAKQFLDAVKPQFDTFWDFRTGAKEKAADYVKNYVNDPTIAAVPIPVKVETADNLNAPAAPTAAAGDVKLTGGGAPAPGAAGGKASANGNGKTSTKAAPTKNTKAKPKPKKRGR